MKRYRALTREHAEVQRMVAALPAATSSASATWPRRARCCDDPEMARDGARGDRRRRGRPRRAATTSCRPRCCRSDPDDARNTFLEIRAGTGGDESALFAGDLLRMYRATPSASGWRTEMLSARATASSAATRKW